MHDLAQVKSELAPTGVLRVAINFGNPVLAQPGPQGAPKGVSVALAECLAQEVNLDVEFITFDAAGKVFGALAENAWNIAFLAIEPVREAQLHFSTPYVIIEGTYLVASGSRYQTAADLDHAEAVIAVGRGAAYDLFLSRTLTAARLERADTSVAAVELFCEQRLDAAAGVRQPLDAFAKANAGLRVLKDSFTSIQQAIAVPRGRTLAAAYIQDFIERQLKNNFVTKALLQSGQADLSAKRKPGVMKTTSKKRL